MISPDRFDNDLSLCQSKAQKLPLEKQKNSSKKQNSKRILQRKITS
jgi:hypothetical protein